MPLELLRHIVPADNSCLFHAVDACISGSEAAVIGGAQALRRLAASHMLSYPEEFSEAVLGRPPAAYAESLAGSSTWGGALECRALADALRVQVATADIRTASLMVFGEDRSFARRLYLLYDGIHYDYLATASGTRLFSPDDSAAATAAVAATEALRRAHAYTDTAHFSLLCTACGATVAGAAEAEAHAQVTGHSGFVEQRSPV